MESAICTVYTVRDCLLHGIYSAVAGKYNKTLRLGIYLYNDYSKKPQGENIMENATKLLVCAGTLMLIAGAIFGFVGQWIYAALIWAGALGIHS